MDWELELLELEAEYRAILPDDVSAFDMAALAFDFDAFAKRAPTDGSPRVTGINLREERIGLAAAHKTLTALARKATSDMERRRYLNAMRVVLAELAAVVQAELDGIGARLGPLTQAFKASAGELKSIHGRAVQMIGNLNLAADILGAFGKLVAAL